MPPTRRSIQCAFPYRASHHPSSTLCAPADPRFYFSHWQLRHYISAPEPDILYYASGHDIYCLNTASKKRKHIATLPFEARCTASGYGWICVGGEDDGHFAAIKLDGAHRPEADNRRAAGVKVERIGEEIVNSISIHRVRDEDAHLDDIVAVLTNNDKTVRLYSLPQGLETTVLDLPFPMNHATISPDGQTLVVVGDVNRAYFFSRHVRAAPPQIPKPHNRLTSSSIEWTLVSVVIPHISRPDSGPSTSGYFTTAWAPNGRLVAVGSEGGFITVFDVDILQDATVEDTEAIVAVVPSSRADLPPPHPGAVRSMLFSPDPWDLLIWAEDQGRVCIGDLRTGLKRKQVIYLEPHEEGLRKVTYEDVPADEAMPTISAAARDIDDLQTDLIRRYRDVPDNAAAVNFAEYSEASRRQRQHRQDLAAIRAFHIQQTRDSTTLPILPPDNDDPQGLTAQEQQILESLRTTRRREEARAHAGMAPPNVTYTSADMFGRSPSSSSPSHSRQSNDGGPATTRPFSGLLANIPDSISLLDRAAALPPLESYSEGLYSTSSRLPRRRQSVVQMSSSGNNRPSYASIGTDMAETGAAEDDDEDETHWRTIQEHMTLARGPLFESAARATSADGTGAASSFSPAPQPESTSTTSATFRHLSSPEELQAELTAERARARSLARERDRWRSIRVVSDIGTSASMREQQEDRDATAVDEEVERRRLPEGYEALLRRRTQRRGGYTTFTATGAPPPPTLTPHEVRTAGLAISEDGRRLWAACEEGIFEIEVNVKGRWFWPSVEAL